MILPVSLVNLAFLACTSQGQPLPSDTSSDSGDTDALGCVAGATQACVGSGGCSGGQVCEADQTWGECDCGSADADADTDADSDADSDADTDTDADADTDADTDAEPTHLDLHEAILYNNPADEADWPVSTNITLVTFGEGVHVEFSKQDGDERWPDVTPDGWDGPLQYTLGLAEKIDGQWYASAAIQYWYGLWESGGNVALDNQIAVNWYYDSRWGELMGRQPATGETVGLFVIAGNVRGVEDGSQSPIMERSDVVLFPFPDTSGATYTY